MARVSGINLAIAADERYVPHVYDNEHGVGAALYVGGLSGPAQIWFGELNDRASQIATIDGLVEALQGIRAEILAAMV